MCKIKNDVKNSIEIRDIEFSFGDTEVIKGASLDFKEGKIYALLGENGAGKTTLLKILSSIYLPKKGEVAITGTTILVRENPCLFQFITVKQHLKSLQCLEKKINDTEIERLIRNMGLNSKKNVLAHKLSLGMRYKLMLISSFLMEHDIYLLDEPFTALDSRSRKFVRAFLKSLVAQGKIVIVATHLLHDAFELTDEILILNEGGLIKKENHFKKFSDFEKYIQDVINGKTDV